MKCEAIAEFLQQAGPMGTTDCGVPHGGEPCAAKAVEKRAGRRVCWVHAKLIDDCVRLIRFSTR